MGFAIDCQHRARANKNAIHASHYFMRISCARRALARSRSKRSAAFIRSTMCSTGRVSIRNVSGMATMTRPTALRLMEIQEEIEEIIVTVQQSCWIGEYRDTTISPKLIFRKPTA